MVPNRLKELRLKCGFTLQELAAKTGTTAPQVNKLERGERRMTIDWMTRLAPALGVEPKDLLPPPDAYADSTATAKSPSENVSPTMLSGDGMLGPPPKAGDPRDMIPVRSAGRGGNEQEMFLQDGAIDFVRRPPWLAHVRDAYTIYMIGDSMWPRFRQGQLLHVNPYRPPREGAGVVVLKLGNAVLIKEFIRRTPTALVLRQLNPAREIEYPLEEIVSVDTVVGLEEP